MGLGRWFMVDGKPEESAKKAEKVAKKQDKKTRGIGFNLGLGGLFGKGKE